MQINSLTKVLKHSTTKEKGEGSGEKKANKRFFFCCFFFPSCFDLLFDKCQNISSGNQRTTQ